MVSSLVSSALLLSAHPDYRFIVELLRVIAFVFVPLALGQRAQGNQNDRHVQQLDDTKRVVLYDFRFYSCFVRVVMMGMGYNEEWFHY